MTRTPLLLMLWLALAGCGAAAVRTQAAAAETTARAFNRALPAVVAEYERAGRAAIDGACCERAAMEAALAAHDRRWQPVVAAWEVARVAHDAWRREIEACRARPSATCAPALAPLAARVAAATHAARCAVRALGRPDLDPLPGPLACDGGTDGRDDAATDR